MLSFIFLSHTPFYTRKAEDAYMINVNNNSMNWQKKLRERNKQIREFIKKKTRIKSLVALLFYPSWRKNSDDGKANSDKHIQLFFFFLSVFQRHFQSKNAENKTTIEPPYHRMK